MKLSSEELKLRHNLASKRWKIKNRKRKLKTDSLYRSKPKNKYGHLVTKSKHRKIEMSLSFEEYKEIISSNECYYCRAVLPISGTGIDRIDSDKGYTKENCRPCCSDCNTAKNSMTESRFKEWVTRVYNSWVSK